MYVCVCVFFSKKILRDRINERLIFVILVLIMVNTDTRNLTESVVPFD